MRKIHSCLLFIILLQLLVSHCTAAIQVQKLECEYRTNPLGIDTLTPRLSWQMNSLDRGQHQTAYQVLVASSPSLLQTNQGDLWDSGKVLSDQSCFIRYTGKTLSARKACFWKVRIWDKDGQASDYSAMNHWEIGLPQESDWQDTPWIQLDKDNRDSPLTYRNVKTRNMAKPRQAQAYPSPLLRRTFSAKGKLQRARAYVCGLGYHEVYVNGQRCGDAVLEPGQTTYDQRAYYVTYDITASLINGNNAIGVILGNGFFGQNHAFNAPFLGYGPPCLRAMIVLDYVDGRTETVVTNTDWKANTGPILYDNVYGGESYDARLEKEGWQQSDYDDSDWEEAVERLSPTKSIQAQMIPPIRCMKILKPKSVLRGRNSKWIFDLGQNISGWARIQVQAPAGTQINLRFAEILSDDRTELNMITTGLHAMALEQKNIYVCKGEGVEHWEPRFAYHGFRYIEVEGLLEKPGADFLKGVMVRTAVPTRGSFACSDSRLNQIYRTSLWTLEDNLHSVLEDCPHREKCAWLGDTHAVGETAIFNYDMAQFFTKFADDIETVLGRGGVTYWRQKATPGIPCNIAVGKRLCQEARPDWGAAYVLVPWYLYTYYGDTEVFTRHYDHLKRWINYVKGLREEGIVVRGYGDWCPPGTNETMECPVPLTSTAFFYASLRMMADFAQHLNREEEVDYFNRLASETKEAFNHTFFNKDRGGYGSQTADAVVLRFDLAPEGEKRRVGQSLRQGVMEQHRGHAFVGIHGARPLYTQLSAYGYSDVAIAAMKEPTWPSYAYTLSQGLTTWPEILDEFARGESTSGRSLNHPMQSGFAAWFHESLGGIQPGAPGFKHIVLKPQGYTSLAWVKAEHQSPYGLIKSHWRSNYNRFEWEVSIPANSQATVHVPVKQGEIVTEQGQAVEEQSGVRFIRYEEGRAVYRLESGSYSFESMF